MFVGDLAGEIFAIFPDDTFAIFLVIFSTFIIQGKLVLLGRNYALHRLANKGNLFVRV